MWHSIQRLDPSTGAPLPRYLSMQFFNIVYRARRLLAGRSADDIRETCEVINSIRRAPGFEDPAFASIRNWEPLSLRGPNGQTVEAMPSASDAGELLYNLDRIDLAKLNNPRKAVWHELFGAMALSFVDMAARLEADRKRVAKGHGGFAALREGLRAQLAEYAIIGMEAVTIGEALLRGNRELEAKDDQLWAARIRSQGRKGGKARGQRSRELFGELLLFMQGRSFPSDRQAVLRFLEQCDKALLKGFSPDNRVRLLYKKLRDSRKGLLT